MKKYLFGALALPLLFACSSEDFTEQEVISNDPFAGIEKVDATFTMDEGQITRMDNGTGWELKNGDLYGFAWLTDAHTETGYTPKVAITGDAFQNHNLIQTNGRFEPQTSIYVGKYFIYRPYDETTTAPGPINFNSLKEQTLAEGQASGFGTDVVTPWKKLAETAIIIGDKWTEILPAGHTYTGDDTVWDLPGSGKPYKVYAAIFSNQTGLDLTYLKNNPSFSADKNITGATDINLTYAAGDPVGAADIYGATVQLAGASNSFTYAPTTEPSSTHSGTYWADKENLGTSEGFTFATAAPITLTPADQKISTGAEGSKAWFWFNSLPVTAGDATSATTVISVFKTSYGTITINTANTLKDIAYEHVNFGTATVPNWQWVKLVDGTTNDLSSTPKKWGIDAGSTNNTFVNQYGNHRGKYTFTVDFSTGVMDKMHIIDDNHLQKLLKFYLASGKTENATLLLDKDADGEFKISKISIALLQTINAGSSKVLVKACDEIDGVASTEHTPGRIVVTQDDQTGDLANAKEVPALKDVFASTSTKVYLSKDCQWTWGGGSDAKTALEIDANVSSITNEGTLTVNATNVELSVAAATLENAKGATMNITKVTTVKNALTNLGTINVGSDENTTAELRAYGVAITNDATDASVKEQKGLINNYGVVGVTAATSGKFYNYGIIEMKDDDAMTLLTSNEIGTKPFGVTFGASNKMGTVVLPEGKPYAIVSVSNKAENGFIKYNWTADTYTHDTGNVKYNTIVVNKDITFTGDPAVNPATEIQYIEFNGTKTQVVNPGAAGTKGLLTELKGIIVNENQSIVIEKNNTIYCSVASWVAPGATIYKGGYFNANSTTSIFGTWSNEQVVTF